MRGPGSGASGRATSPSVAWCERARSSMAREMWRPTWCSPRPGARVYEAAATGTPVVVVAPERAGGDPRPPRLRQRRRLPGIGPLVDDAQSSPRPSAARRRRSAARAHRAAAPIDGLSRRRADRPPHPSAARGAVSADGSHIVEVQVEGTSRCARARAGSSRRPAPTTTTRSSGRSRWPRARPQAGAWAIKFQLYKADGLAFPTRPSTGTDAIGTTTQYEAFRLSDHLDYGDYEEVAEACASSASCSSPRPSTWRPSTRWRRSAHPSTRSRAATSPPTAAGGGRGDREADPALDRCGDARRDRAGDRVDRLGPERLVPSRLHADLPDAGRGRGLRPDRDVQARGSPPTSSACPTIPWGRRGLGWPPRSAACASRSTTPSTRRCPMCPTTP